MHCNPDATARVQFIDHLARVEAQGQTSRLRSCPCEQLLDAVLSPMSSPTQRASLSRMLNEALAPHSELLRETAREGLSVQLNGYLHSSIRFVSSTFDSPRFLPYQRTTSPATKASLLHRCGVACSPSFPYALTIYSTKQRSLHHFLMLSWKTMRLVSDI